MPRIITTLALIAGLLLIGCAVIAEISTSRANASVAQTARVHYCGGQFILREPLGYGANDFYVTNVSCTAARHEVDRWFRRRQPRHVDGWTFTRGYTIRASHGKQRLRCYLFGTD